MLDNFSPTTAIVGTKANFSLLSCYGDTGIRDGREIVVESVLEPQPVNGHYSPTGIISISSLRPIIATTGNTVETILEQTPKLHETEAYGSFLLIEIAYYRQRDE